MNELEAVELEAGEATPPPGGEEPRQLLKELTRIDAGRRERVARWERYRRLDLAELLLQESEASAVTSPVRSRDLAWTAQLVAEQPYPVASAARVDRILARSRCLQGNALRLLGDRRGAEAHFQAAACYLTGPPDSAERGLYCRELASLREEQGRFDEASALLWRAVGIFRSGHELEEQGACLCRVAFLFFYEGDVEAAGRLFAQARGLLSFARSPGLAARCTLGMAVCLAALGEEAEARSLRSESFGLIEAVSDARERLEIDWLEGRLAALLGEHEHALADLDRVRRRLFQQGRLVDAALCTLDLVRVHVRTGSEARIGELTVELQTGFPVSLDQVRMLVALEDFRCAAREGADVEAAAREAVDLIRRPAAVLRKLA